MARGWYGLYINDNVLYSGRRYRVVELSITDKNRCTLEDFTGERIQAVCEWCQKTDYCGDVIIFTPGEKWTMQS